jgi:hypothetical protein
MRGSSARHFFSSLSSSRTFSSEGSEAIGSISRYSWTGVLRSATLVRRAWPAEAIARVAFAASCSALKLISSE